MLLLIAWGLGAAYDDSLADERAVCDIGSRRELFVDDYLIERMDGTRLTLQTPRPAETVLRFDRPYEGVFSGYVSVINDGPTYRLYYRGLNSVEGGKADHSIDNEVTCYAESRDGIHFSKPDLGLYEVRGSRNNNVILARHEACTNFCPFLDTRPDVETSRRFKAVGGNHKTGLLGFVSADGIHWQEIKENPLITEGAFDSQNLVFWSEAEGCYVAYFRISKMIGDKRYRWISRATSPDFIQWSEPVEMQMGDVPPEQYYTNQTLPYFRAPHIYIAIFARFMPGRQVVTTAQAEELGVTGDYAEDCSDAAFMTSRGGNRYDRSFMESFIRPGPGLENWVSRTNYPALGVVPTGPIEMSCYVQRHYARSDHHLQRVTLRKDGFVCIKAPYEGGELVTKPLTFQGCRLGINFATSAAGEIRVEIQDASGKGLPGYRLAESKALIGDRIDGLASWQSGTDVGRLAGQPVRLRFVMKDADLYSICFHD